MEDTTLAAIAGTNARNYRTRHGLRIEQVSRAAKDHGLKWSPGRVADLERGADVSPTLPTLIALTATLDSLTGETFTFADLMSTSPDTSVEINDDVTMTGAALAGAVTGGPVEVLPSRDDMRSFADKISSYSETLNGWEEHMPAAVKPGDLRKTRHDVGLADERAAKKLGVPTIVLTAHALNIWGHPMNVERDHRLDADATAQKRGRVTRELVGELRSALQAHGIN